MRRTSIGEAQHTLQTPVCVSGSSIVLEIEYSNLATYKDYGARQS